MVMPIEGNLVLDVYKIRVQSLCARFSCYVGRILDMRKRGDDKRKYYYVVYRNADAQVYAFIITEFEGKPRIVVSDRRGVPPSRYLWEYTWNY